MVGGNEEEFADGGGGAVEEIEEVFADGGEGVCVCFWPQVLKWGPVRHEIPISSPPLDDIPSIP